MDAWKTVCQFCQEKICFAHDVRGFKARICGYRDLSLEDRVMKEDMLRVAQNALKCKLQQIQAMDQITCYLQEHGQLDAHHEHELALVTELPPAGNDEDLGELEDLTIDDFNKFLKQHCVQAEETERRLREEEEERRRLEEEYRTSNQIAEHLGDFFAGLDADS
ncbi:MAG: hypothetical protein LQ350_001798 [Teloschistes chrysophthalmus]|nr:MAG: hypothetical protein LQ350_001798 [Niorma chrysophthalma]